MNWAILVQDAIRGQSHDWVKREAKRRGTTVQAICADLHLPQQDGLLEFDRFPEFIEERHRILGTKLRELLASA
jgi:hypothetical protein